MERKKVTEAVKSDEDLMEDFSMFSNIFAVNNSKHKIKELERKLLEGRKWQEKGETSSKKRTQNALLDEDLEFEQGIEKNIFISQKVNLKYEDIIRNRIADELFDDRTFEAFYLDQLRLNEQGFNAKKGGTNRVTGRAANELREGRAGTRGRLRRRVQSQNQGRVLPKGKGGSAGTRNLETVQENLLLPGQYEQNEVCSQAREGGRVEEGRVHGG